MEFSSIDILWILLCSALVFLMQAGFTYLEAGLVRSKNSINVAIKNAVDFSISSFIFWAVGFAIIFGIHNLELSSAFFFSPASRDSTTTFTTAYFLFQMMFCGTAATLISGALSERSRFTTYMIISALVAGILYPVFAHWAWEGNLAPFLPGDDRGWLETLGFIDFAGSTVVHSLAGWVALAAVMIVGPRLGRFGEHGRFIQGHDIPKAALGMFLLWLGWLGFNGGSLMYFGADVPSVLMHTMIGGMAGMLAALFLCWRLKGVLKPHYPINGSLAGLVAVTASANIISSVDAFIIGGAGGALMLLGMHVLERAHIDDAIGVVPVHLFAGVWGTLAVALFGDVAAFGDGVSRLDQLGIQLLGVLTCALWAFGVGYLVLASINRFYPLRVSEADERRGLNMSEHGASTEAFELLTHMAAQQQHGDFSQHVPSQQHTEVGQIAAQYNHVLDAVAVKEADLQSIHAKLKISALSYEAIRHLFDAIVSTDALGNIHSVNRAACHIFGYSEAEMLGQNVEMLMPERYRQMHRKGMQRLRETGESKVSGQVIELFGLRADGAEFPLEFAIESYRIDGVLYFTAVMRDLTARKQAETQMAQLATVVRQADDSIIITDSAGIIQYVNPAFEKLSGYSEDEALGQLPGLVKSGEHDEAFYAELWACIGRGESWNGTFINRAKDGQHYHVDQTISPIFDQMDSIIGYAAVQRDVTERNRLQAKVEHAQRLESLGVLAGGIAHDFNNLLTSIMGNASLALMQTDADDPRHNQLHQTIQASESAAVLCRQMLAYSGKGKFIVEKIDLSASVRETLGLLRSSIDKRSHMLLSLLDDLPLIEGDAGQIQQVVMNLMINASEALEGEQGDVSISTSVQRLNDDDIDQLYTADDMRTGDFVVLAVRDSGCGMTAETMEKIFDPFFTTKFTGRGLGMSAILGIVRAQHGGIAVHSVVGEGSEFRIWFPALEADAKATDETVGQHEMSQPSMQAEVLAATAGSGMILVVEDEAIVRDIACAILGNKGYHTLEAEDGRVGLALFKQRYQEIDLVLLDLTMPHMHGDEVYRRMRQIKPDVRVVVCSGYAKDEVAERFDAHEALRFVAKPYRPEVLLNTVQTLLQQ